MDETFPCASLFIAAEAFHLSTLISPIACFSTSVEDRSVTEGGVALAAMVEFDPCVLLAPIGVCAASTIPDPQKATRNSDVRNAIETS
jgi:hypothetical protein